MPTDILRHFVLVAAVLCAGAPALAQRRVGPVRAPVAPASVVAQTALTPSVQTVTIPAATPPAASLVRDPLVCSHGALRSLAVSDFWTRIAPVCARLATALPHRIAPPSGVPSELMTAVVNLCDRGASARPLCGLDAYRRDLLVSRVDALSQELPRRLETAARLCPEVELAAVIAPSAPEAMRAEVHSAIEAETDFCAREDGTLPTLRELALVRLAREVSRAALASSLAPDAPEAAALWSQRAAGPGADDLRPQAAHRNRETDGTRGHEGESASGGAIGGVGIGSVLPTPAGLVEVALRGLADFLQSRAQAELESFMLDQLRDVVCTGDAAPWFEYTCAYLVAPDAALRISAGSALRTAFRSDVLSFPRRVAARAPMTGDTRTLLGTLWFKLLGGATESRTLTDFGERFVEVGAGFACTDREPALCERARNAVEGTGLLVSFALLRDDLGTLPPTLYHSLAETVFDRGLSTDALVAVEGLRSALLEARGSVTIAQQPQRTPAARIPRVAAVLSLLRPLFARGVAVAFFDDRLGVRVALADGLPDMYAAVMRADLVEVAVQSQRAVTVVLPLTGLPPDVLRGIILAAEIAQAQNPDQVRAALEAVVVPPGAWRMKRRRAMLSITGLVGVAGGADLLLASGISNAGVVPSVGLVGALGLDVSFPAGSSTLGVYVSVVDLGGLLSVPLGDSTANLRGPDGVERAATLDVTNRISPEQILSPGVFFRWGIGRSPFVFAAGASMVPFGRTVTEVRTGNDSTPVFTTDASIFRLSALLGVDLTLLPF